MSSFFGGSSSLDQKSRIRRVREKGRGGVWVPSAAESDAGAGQCEDMSFLRTPVARDRAGALGRSADAPTGNSDVVAGEGVL